MKRMMKAYAAVALATMVSTLMVWAADNPFKNAKVGEWAEFFMTTEVMGQKMESTLKQSIIARDAVSVTLRTVNTMMGKELPPVDKKIMLNEPYEPYKSLTHGLSGAGYSDAVVTPLGEGSETLTAGGKPYNCRWSKVKMVAVQPQAMESTVKVWMCKDVPVSGMVRMEMDSTVTKGGKTMATKVTFELVGAGK